MRIFFFILTLVLAIERTYRVNALDIDDFCHMKKMYTDFLIYDKNIFHNDSIFALFSIVSNMLGYAKVFFKL